MWRRAAVKDSSSAVTGTASRRPQRACGCRLAAQRGGFAGAHQLGWRWSQAQASWMTRRGEPGAQDGGRRVRFPAPVIVVLSSPNVVSDALQPGEIRVPHRVRGGGLVIEEGGDHGAGLGDLLFPVAGGHDHVVLGGPHGQPFLLSPRTGRSARSMRDPSGSQPPPSSSGSATVALTRAITWPPASRIAVVISSWPGKITIEAGQRPANRSGRRFASRFSRVCSPA